MSTCTQTDVEDIFGAANVAKWADIDSDADPSKITARIAKAIVAATAEVEDRLRGGPYAIPFSGDSATVTGLIATMAGVWLYEARGIQDTSEETGVHRLTAQRRQCENKIREILAGKIRLPCSLAGRGTSAPMVVRE